MLSMDSSKIIQALGFLTAGFFMITVRLFFLSRLRSEG